MLRGFFVSLIFLFFAGCGKNDVVPNGTYQQPPYYPPPVQGPVNQAPVPPGGGYYPPPGGGYGGPGGPQMPPPYFQPQMPQGMPPQYYPWLPMDNYFRRTPQMTQVWINIWINWQGYAQRNRYDVYDFPRFWTEYCPSQWQNTQYIELYQYFNESCYSWVGPETQFPTYSDPNYFWQNYTGMSYGGYDNSCDDCWSSY